MRFRRPTFIHKISLALLIVFFAGQVLANLHDASHSSFDHDTCELCHSFDNNGTPLKSNVLVRSASPSCNVSEGRVLAAVPNPPCTLPYLRGPPFQI